MLTNVMLLLTFVESRVSILYGVIWSEKMIENHLQPDEFGIKPNVQQCVCADDPTPLGAKTSANA